MKVVRARPISSERSAVLVLVVSVVFFFTSCHKQVASAPAAPAPAPQPSATAPVAASRPAPAAAPRGNAGSAPAASSLTLEQMFEQSVKDSYFDYDKADIRADARDALTRDADFLRAHPNVKITIEGHCDERGGEEYNLALGDRRAAAAKEFLVSAGIPTVRIQTVSLGKEHPFCTAENESCFQQNRRGHFVMAP